MGGRVQKSINKYLNTPVLIIPCHLNVYHLFLQEYAHQTACCHPLPPAQLTHHLIRWHLIPIINSVILLMLFTPFQHVDLAVFHLYPYQLITIYLHSFSFSNHRFIHEKYIQDSMLELFFKYRWSIIEPSINYTWIIQNSVL